MYKMFSIFLSLQPDTLATKLVHLVCYNTYCRELCDNCLHTQHPNTTVKKRIQKEDIEHVVRTQPLPSTSSAASDTATERSIPSPRMPGIAPIAVMEASSLASFRDRMDSDDSSRKGSTSSGSDYRRSPGPFVTPIIDMKPIEFWAATNRETVQPRTPKRRLNSESDFSLENFNPDLYESIEERGGESLTDEEKLIRYNLGEIHISVNYEIDNNMLTVKIMEAKDLPRPLAQDNTRNDMAHSNPYAKVTLLPDHKNSRQTSVQRKTQSPVWDETFLFDIPFRQAQEHTLAVIVRDFDKYSRHCVIGQMHLSLSSVNLIKGGHMWKPLVPSQVVSIVVSCMLSDGIYMYLW